MPHTIHKAAKKIRTQFADLCDFKGTPFAALLFRFNDGGRKKSGRLGKAGDCVTRAIAIKVNACYNAVYQRIARDQRARGRDKTPCDGVNNDITFQLLDELGFRLDNIGGRLRKSWDARDVPEEMRNWNDLPALDMFDTPKNCIIGLIAVTKDGRKRHGGHLMAVKDGVIQDRFDPRAWTPQHRPRSQRPFWRTKKPDSTWRVEEVWTR